MFEKAQLYDEETNEMIEAVREGKHVHIDWKTNLQYIMKREFLEYDRCDFILVAEEFLEEQIALMMPKNSPYLPLINHEVKLLHQMGFVDLWLKEYLPKKDKCWTIKKGTEVENHTVDLRDMQGCFLVLVFGCAVAMFLIAMECCWAYRKKYMSKRLYHYTH